MLCSLVVIFHGCVVNLTAVVTFVADTIAIVNLEQCQCRQQVSIKILRMIRMRGFQAKGLNKD